MYDFNIIKENEQIIKNFKSMIFNDKLSHAYIIDAPKGFGKKLIANSFAKAIECENVKNFSFENEVDSCGHCTSCTTFESGNHIDIIYVNPSKKSIGVDDIREQIIKNVDVRPYKYKYKIFIINDSDTMTIGAQNALLKTIEEPPDYGIFILLSENYYNFLPTILSRCIIFKLKPLKFNTVLKYLKDNLNIPEKDAYIFASYAQGNIGKSIDMASSEKFINIRNMVIDFIRDFPKKDLIDIFLTVPVFEEYKDDIFDILDILYLCYRDMIVMKVLSKNSDFIIQKDKIFIFEELLNHFSLLQLFYSTSCISSAKKQIKENSNFQMTIENLLLNLKEEK